MPKTLLPFVLHKLLRLFALLLAVTLTIFLLMHAIPGNPWSNYAGENRALSLGLDEPLQRELFRRFGLDLPLWRQFTRYMIGDFSEEGVFFCGVICGNFGPSIQQRGRSVWAVLFDPPEGQGSWDSRFGYSMRLVFLGTSLAVGLGIPLGILSAIQPRAALSRAIAVGLATLVSIPNFVLGLLAIIVLASWLKIIKVLPDWSDPNHWIVPAIVLAVMPMASLARVTRASLMNIMNEDYIRTARAKGLSQHRVMMVHMMRNALVPILTFLAPMLVEMFTGLFIVEYLFSFPGIGWQYWASVLKLDYPMILGLTLIYASVILLVNLVFELASEVLDPRVRRSSQRGAL